MPVRGGVLVALRRAPSTSTLADDSTPVPIVVFLLRRLDDAQSAAESSPDAHEAGERRGYADLLDDEVGATAA